MDDKQCARTRTNQPPTSSSKPPTIPTMSTSSTPSTEAATVPPVMPVLSHGMHRNLSEGACLMEYVSVLAGLPFSDQPRCTAPAAARLARLINDYVSPTSRGQLAQRAPALIGLHQPRLLMRRIILTELIREGLRHDPNVLLLRTVARRCLDPTNFAARWERSMNLVMFTDSRQVFFEVLNTICRRVPGGDAQDERLIAILDAVITRARPDDLGPTNRTRHEDQGVAEAPLPQTVGLS
ncbi:MAG: hypothetical protein ACREQ5_29745 [Candidatus Dormibacteria bacterium]